MSKNTETTTTNTKLLAVNLDKLVVQKTNNRLRNGQTDDGIAHEFLPGFVARVVPRYSWLVPRKFIAINSASQGKKEHVMARLNWGMIGGGEGSQIGPAHRMGAQADGNFVLAAGALDHDPQRGKDYAQQLGVAADRAYGNWEEMLDGEKGRQDRVDLVTVATPNSTHFEITKAFLEAGFNVLCEKPMTMTVEEGEEIVKVAEASGKICAVNYCYSAYPLVREMRNMVANGNIGKVRLIVANFSHGHHGDATDADNPRVRWRYDPEMAGVSGQFADCGIHALHMASFISGDEVKELSADFASTIPSRVLEDDAMVNFRMEGGTVGRLWTSSVAIGRQHGFDIQVFGETGGLKWLSEQPNQVLYTPLGGRTQIVEKGEAGLSSEAARLSRVAIAHPEGFPMAVANIYLDLSAAIRGEPHGAFPTAVDGLRSMSAVYQCAASAKEKGAWLDARPPFFKIGSFLRRDRFHKAVADDDRIHGNDWHLRVAALAFYDHHRANLRIDSVLQRLPGIDVLNLDDIVAPSGARHPGKIGFTPGVCRLISGRAVRAIVDYHQNEVRWHVVPDGWECAEVCQHRSITIDGNDSLRLCEREPKTNRRRQSHRAEHVKVARLIQDRVQLLTWNPDVTNNQLVFEDRGDLFQNLGTDHWSP